MFTTRASPSLLEHRLDPQFYRPDHIRDVSNLGHFTKLALDALRESSTPITYGVLKPRFCNSQFRLARIQNFDDPFLNINGCEGIDERQFLEYRRSETVAGDLLIAIGGYVGRAAIVPSLSIRLNINQHIARFRPSRQIDPHFAVTYLTSAVGKRQTQRYVSGSVQTGINLEDLRKLQIPLPDAAAQRYIGNKVRQAERLRGQAALSQNEIDALSLPETIKSALAVHDSKFNRLAASELNSRLDGKYYGRRAMAVLKACHDAGGVCITALEPRVSNGFEYRDFAETGRPYITVTEVSSERLDITNAPRIPADARVPLKATVNERCTFVVRTGSVGIAVKAHREDSHACISSHLIRLEFEHEAESAAVTAWLNGAAGKCLQEKITYGGVQPQVSQDDLLALPIPRVVLDAGDRILPLWEVRERCLRASSRLVIAAKALVEALIERRIAESELTAAQQAIEKDDYTADHELLARLTQAGFDVPNAPQLFPDLSTLHQTIEAAKGSPRLDAQ